MRTNARTLRPILVLMLCGIVLTAYDVGNSNPAAAMGGFGFGRMGGGFGGGPGMGGGGAMRSFGARPGDCHRAAARRRPNRR